MAATVVVLVVGCSPGDPGPRPAMTYLAPPAAAPTTPADPDARAVRDTGAPFANGPQAAGTLLPVAGGTVQADDTVDGATRRTVVAAAGVVAWVAPPDGGRVEVHADGSATLHDATGTAVTALGAPVTADGASAVWRARGDVLALDAPTGSA